jgi:acylphosphatase|tara:strand:- start:108286 stop:108600 length:315 start_codon:yes stop_codon:yes gene_type:complete
MLKPGQKALRLLIRGRVQGVFFRDWTVRHANDLQLDGWVRNRTDGTVEVLLVGLEDDVDKMAKLCEVGPPSAKVDEIETTTAMGITKKGFIQKPTVNIAERRGF